MAIKITTYTESCPHCGYSFYRSSTPPSKYHREYGNPIKKCPKCGAAYFDTHVQEFALLYLHIQELNERAMNKDEEPAKDEIKQKRAEEFALSVLHSRSKLLDYAYEAQRYIDNFIPSSKLNRFAFESVEEKMRNNPREFIDSFDRLNTLPYAFALFECDFVIPDVFLREVYYCDECKRIVGRQTGREKFCSQCASRLKASGIHVYEWKAFPELKRKEIERSWGWEV